MKIRVHGGAQGADSCRRHAGGFVDSIETAPNKEDVTKFGSQAIACGLRHRLVVAERLLSMMLP
jgi:hypothetical protein